MQPVVIVDLQAFESAELALNEGMLRRISERAKGVDRIDDRREDRAETAAVIEMLDRPLRCFVQSALPKRLQRHRFDHFQNDVERIEECAPQTLTRHSAGSQPAPS